MHRRVQDKVMTSHKYSNRSQIAEVFPALAAADHDSVIRYFSLSNFIVRIWESQAQHSVLYSLFKRIHVHI